MSGILDSFLPGNSFGGTNFWILQSAGQSVPDFGLEALYKIDPVPYGGGRRYLQTTNTVQKQPMQFTAVIKATDYPALLARVNSVATLIITDRPGVAAFLARAAQPRDYAQGYWYCDLTLEDAS